MYEIEEITSKLAEETEVVSNMNIKPDEVTQMDGDNQSALNGTANVDQSATMAEVHKENMSSEHHEMLTLKVEPEFKALIPPLTNDEYAALKESIKTHGCHDPLIIWKGRNIILDGHNRYQICRELDLRFEVVEIELSSHTDAKIWMIKNQRARRNLNESQRAMLAVRLEELYSEKAKDRKGTRTDLGQNLDQGEAGRSAEKAAKDMGVSHQTVSFAKKVVKEGVPGLKKIVESGEVAVSAAAKVASRPANVQEKIVEKAEIQIKEGKHPKMPALIRENGSKTSEIDFDEQLENFRKDLEANLELLEGIETTKRPENLGEMLSVTEKMVERLREIETSSFDPKIKSQAYCIIELDHFKAFIESIVPISERANLKFDSDGVRVMAADPSANIIAEAFLPKVLFSHYVEIGEIGLPDTSKLLEKLTDLSTKKLAGKKNLLIYVEPGKGDKDQGKLHGHSGTNKIEYALESPSQVEGEGVPDSVSTCEVRVDGSDLVKALRQSKVNGKTGKFSVSDKKFKIVSEDENAKGIATPNCQVLGDGSADSVFAIDQLLAIKHTIEKCGDAKLSLGMNQPMILDLDIDKMAIKYFVKEKEVKTPETHSTEGSPMATASS